MTRASSTSLILRTVLAKGRKQLLEKRLREEQAECSKEIGKLEKHADST